MTIQIQRKAADECWALADDCHLATIKRTKSGHVITDHDGNFEGIQLTQPEAVDMVKRIYWSA